MRPAFAGRSVGRRSRLWSAASVRNYPPISPRSGPSSASRVFLERSVPFRASRGVRRPASPPIPYKFIRVSSRELGIVRMCVRSRTVYRIPRTFLQVVSNASVMPFNFIHLIYAEIPLDRTRTSVGLCIFVPGLLGRFPSRRTLHRSTYVGTYVRTSCTCINALCLPLSLLFACLFLAANSQWHRYRDLPTIVTIDVSSGRGTATARCKLNRPGAYKCGAIIILFFSLRKELVPIERRFMNWNEEIGI